MTLISTKWWGLDVDWAGKVSAQSSTVLKIGRYSWATFNNRTAMPITITTQGQWQITGGEQITEWERVHTRVLQPGKSHTARGRVEKKNGHTGMRRVYVTYVPPLEEDLGFGGGAVTGYNDPSTDPVNTVDGLDDPLTAEGFYDPSTAGQGEGGGGGGSRKTALILLLVVFLMGLGGGWALRGKAIRRLLGVGG